MDRNADALYVAELALPAGWNVCECGRHIPCRHCPVELGEADCA